MIKFDWSILEIDAKDGIIKSAKYFCRANDDGIVVETEGNWRFRDPEGKVVPFEEIKEETVIKWINAEAIRDGKNLITSRLEEQIAAIKDRKPVVAPWLPQVFKPEI